MPAIITNAFRTYNADNFISSFSTNKVYLMIGKADAWSGADLGQYTESSPTDTVIPTPIDTTVAPYIHHNDMIAAKLINTSDVSHVIKRNNFNPIYINNAGHRKNYSKRNYFHTINFFPMYKPVRVLLCHH